MNQKNIQIYIRIRPILQHESANYVWFQNKNCIFSDQQSFQFDQIYDQYTNTKQIYQESCQSIIEKALEGYSGNIFMYGQTTSGKTFTMLGIPEQQGILQHAFQNICSILNARSHNENISIHISYIEIYNEQIRDLLESKDSIKLKENGELTAKKQQVWTVDQMNLLLNYGEKNRLYRKTHNHEHSSRLIEKYQFIGLIHYLEELFGAKILSQLNFIDLAGSERIKDQIKGNDLETGYINKSLFALSNVINKLAENKAQKHIPYRDSKLTWILNQDLNRKSMTAFVCCISPSDVNYFQTLSTLRFAQKAKNIELIPQKDIQIAENAVIHELNQKITELEKANKELIVQNIKYTQWKNQYKKEKKQDLQNLQMQIKILQEKNNLLEQLNIKSNNEICELQLQLKSSIDNYRLNITNIDESIDQIQQNHDTIKSFDQYQLKNKIFNSKNQSKNFKRKISKSLTHFSVDDELNLSQTSFRQNQNNSPLKPILKISELLQNDHMQSNGPVSPTFNNIQKDNKHKYKFQQIVDIKKFKQGILWSNKLQQIIQSKNSYQFSCISSGKSHYLGISDGMVFTWEYNEGAQNEHKQQDYQTNIQNIKILNKFTVIQVSCGYAHSIILTQQGLLFSWGNNEYGQLGIGETQENILTPTLIKSINQITTVKCGYQHSGSVDQYNQLFMWGKNDEQQLFLENKQHQQYPYPVKHVEPQILSLGSHHSMVLLKNQKLQYSINQICDYPIFYNKISDIQCANNYSLILLNDGQCYCHYNFKQIIKIFENIIVVKISSYGNNSSCIDQHGQCYTLVIQPSIGEINEIRIPEGLYAGYIQSSTNDHVILLY